MPDSIERDRDFGRLAHALSAGIDRRNLKAPRLFAAQRNRGPEKPELERVAAQRRTNERQIGAFDQAENHQSQYRRIPGVDRLDRRSFTGGKFGQVQSAGSNANDSRYCIPAAKPIKVRVNRMGDALG
jgi:hypothetical protein